MEITRLRPRIAIIVNKRREVEGFLAGLRGSGILSHLEVKDQHIPLTPCHRMSKWRMNASLEQMDFTVRCIEDIMPPADSRAPKTSYSFAYRFYNAVKDYNSYTYTPHLPILG